MVPKLAAPSALMKSAVDASAKRNTRAKTAAMPPPIAAGVPASGAANAARRDRAPAWSTQRLHLGGRRGATAARTASRGVACGVMSRSADQIRACRYIDPSLSIGLPAQTPAAPPQRSAPREDAGLSG